MTIDELAAELRRLNERLDKQAGIIAQLSRTVETLANRMIVELDEQDRQIARHAKNVQDLTTMVVVDFIEVESELAQQREAIDSILSDDDPADFWKDR